jgi:hypothetical protein
MVSFSYVGNADLGLGELQALLNNGEQCSWWHERAVYVSLTDVRLNSENVRRMHET